MGIPRHPRAEETRRLTALADIARQDPRAAYDLALRYYRGDGVRRDSYQAIRWMREAGDRGVPEAQLEAVSFGKDKPRATGTTAADYAENRRADVVYDGE